MGSEEHLCPESGIKIQYQIHIVDESEPLDTVADPAGVQGVHSNHLPILRF